MYEKVRTYHSPFSIPVCTVRSTGYYLSEAGCVTSKNCCALLAVRSGRRRAMPSLPKKKPVSDDEKARREKVAEEKKLKKEEAKLAKAKKKEEAAAARKEKKDTAAAAKAPVPTKSRWACDPVDTLRTVSVLC